MNQYNTSLTFPAWNLDLRQQLLIYNHISNSAGIPLQLEFSGKCEDKTIGPVIRIIISFNNTVLLTSRQFKKI